jgi:hypothetical protein
MSDEEVLPNSKPNDATMTISGKFDVCFTRPKREDECDSMQEDEEGERKGVDLVCQSFPC